MKKLALIVLDGWGIGEPKENNAIYMAKTPFFDYLWDHYPHTKLQASGEFVGLPKGQIGGSEVGHLTIGAGQVLLQTLPRINRSLADPEHRQTGILNLPGFQQFIKLAQRHPTHLIGLVSAGGIHSHIDHLFAILKLMKQMQARSPYVHFISDGRDRPPHSAINDAIRLLQLINQLKYGKVATLSGRYYAMDRDNNLDRTDRAARTIAAPQSDPAPGHHLSKLSDHVRFAYNNDVTDEFIEPVRVDRDFSGLNPAEPLFFFNFRTDRMKQLVRTIHRLAPTNPIFTMTRYDAGFPYPVIFDKVEATKTLGKLISEQAARQLRTAETEKAPHVTYFFNGGTELVYPHEHRVMTSSNKVKHDAMPEMKAEEITRNVIKTVKQLSPQFVLANYANSDMVGHTGNFPAIKRAVEKVDAELKTLCRFLSQAGYVCVITADHGNADVAFDLKTRQPHTAHTLNPVPFVIYAPHQKDIHKLRLNHDPNAGLSLVAGTVLQLMEIPKPKKGFVSLILDS
ncbi:2,3-bisphosphoglycerate-independent phosphoglycerate mutase [Patescibacteria group bacterium]|nr:2,3-bisphosphoglycerate-independent phosphoglycerate mutase [Patescibacteria group bacterium]MCL5091508.1 2,3-bisphosphoglycerate-independent phosphoglycerate mutase [Patescibacteria group bacterium]